MKTEVSNQYRTIDELNLEAEKISRTDPSRMLEIALEAKSKAEGAKYVSGLARALCNIGTAYWRMSNYSEALHQYQQALSSYEQLHDDERRMRVLLNIGLVHQSETKYDKALENFFDSLRICEEHDDLAGKAVVLANIGAVYYNLSRYEKAMEHLLAALSIAEELNDRPRIAGIIGNIARTYRELGQHELALNYQFKSLEIYEDISDKVGESRTLLNIGLNYERRHDYDTTLLYYYKALEKFEALHDMAYQAATLLNIGGVYTEIKEFSLALEYLQKALDVTKEIGDRRNYAVALTNIGHCYFKQKNYAESAEYLQKALDVAQELGNTSTSVDICRLLSELFEKTNDAASALRYYKKFFELKEQLQNQDVQRSIAELRIRFEVEKSEKEKEIYRLRNVELANALAQVEALNKHLLDLDNEKNEFLGIVAHDLKNPLAGILVSVSLLQTYFDRLSDDERRRHLSSIESTAKRMSNIITNLLDINAIESGKIQLKPEEFSASDIVGDIIEHFRERALAKNLSLEYNDRTSGVKVITDRDAYTEVIENLLSNAVKYSPHGKTIFIRLEQNDSHLFCEIKDEGPGFSDSDKEKMFSKFARLSAKPTGGEDSTGLGLSIVKKLVEVIGAGISCESEQGAGASFVVTLPVSRPEIFEKIPLEEA